MEKGEERAISAVRRVLRRLLDRAQLFGDTEFWRSIVRVDFLFRPALGSDNPFLTSTPAYSIAKSADVGIEPGKRTGVA